MSWDFSTPLEVQKELDWMREFVDENVIPMELLLDDLPQTQFDAMFAPLKQQVKNRGLWAAHLPPEDGGQGRGSMHLALMHEILGRCDLAPEAFGCQGPDSGNAELIAAGANEAQREKWLYPLMRGEVRSSFSLTELHNSGSDPTGIETTCVRDGDEWVLNGHKWFASNASVADFTVLMAVTDPQAAPHRRASMLIVPKGTPGFNPIRDVGTMSHPKYTEPGDLEQRIGGHTEVKYENCRVPLENMIGEPGDGFMLAQKRLGGGRIHHAMRMIGQCNRAFEMMQERAVSRSTRGKPLGKHQMVQATIAESYAEIEMARLLVLKAAWTMDHFGPHSEESQKEIAACKFAVPNIMLAVIDRAIQIHGSLGYTSDMPLEKMYRTGRALRVADGADEVHKQSVARLCLKGVPVKEGLPTEFIPDQKAKALEKFGHQLEQVKADHQ
ncbi:MAG: acyl-CoA dehydrogenase family protein [Pseudomonadales bacterium]